jgi:hypothetical protein
MTDDIVALDALVASTQSGKPFGITASGFVPKPLARLLDEKVAAARALFGDNVDLTSGSVIRKLLELMSMEEARAWQHLGILYDSVFVARATGEALSMLGSELGIQRPHLRATGSVQISLTQDLPAGTTELVLDLGTRLLTPGGHDYFIAQRVVLSTSAKKADVAVKAFQPGPDSNLDPNLTVGGAHPQQLDRFNPLDGRSDQVRQLQSQAGAPVVKVDHKQPTTGGELFWNDEQYRDLLLAYPRNLWSADAIRIAVALVPGVRQVIVKDRFGGLDINQSIFGNFNFIERLFSEERSLGSPYYFTVLVAMDDGAIWDGAGQLRDRVATAVDAVRPVGIFPNIVEASDVGVGLQCNLTVEGVPIPAGTPSAINTSPEAIALKQRILNRIRRYVMSLGIGDQLRYSEVFWAVMEEPGVVDCKELKLRRYPPAIGSLNLSGAVSAQPQVLDLDVDVTVSPTEVAVLVEDPSPITIL